MATKTKKRFGALVREKRTARGISLRKFAELVGVSATYLLLDAETGAPRMTIAANYLTDMRTAATSAVATSRRRKNCCS